MHERARQIDPGDVIPQCDLTIAILMGYAAGRMAEFDYSIAPNPTIDWDLDTLTIKVTSGVEGDCLNEELREGCNYIMRDTCADCSLEVDAGEVS